MNIIHTLTGALLLSAVLSCSDSPQTTTRCENPIACTDIPDNDLIRVGDDYYMVSTTMFFCPGAPIMHSKDLVHWRIHSYIYDCLADDDIYNMRDGRHAYASGQWATTLRYNDGMYYALFIANDQHKTFVYRTDDIASGKWEQNTIDRPFHDAGLFFEDGRAYVIWGGGDLRITELEPDLSGVKEGGVDQILLSSPKEGISLRAEGTHFYHIGDWYYLIEISWPKGGIRTETCWRSNTLLGEYESKVILSGKADGREDGVAQGGLVDTQNGDWYAVMFQDHGAVGRIPTLQPVTWTDGWPILGNSTLPVKEFDVNLEPCGENYLWDNDEFDSGRNELALVWQWNHKPDNDLWSLTERPGFLRLKAGHKACGVMDARNTLTQRTVGPACQTSVLLDASSLKPGDHAGLCAFQSNYCRIGVTVDENGDKHLEAFTRIPDRRTPFDARLECAEEKSVLDIPLTRDKVWLRLNFNFEPESALGEDDTVTMSWSLDGNEWTTLPEAFKMRYTLDYFIGYRSALYCYPTTDNGGFADFDWYHIDTLSPAATPLRTAADDDRTVWIETLDKIARPVLSNLAEGTLKQNMPFESLSTDEGRKTASRLEAFGRTICGISPWLALGPDDTPEGRLRAEYIDLSAKAMTQAVNPDGPDYLTFGRGNGQSLVDAAFLAQGMLRAKGQIWDRLDETARANAVAEWKRSRSIKPGETNWLLFASMVEAALLEYTGECDSYRLWYGVHRFLDDGWYKGDGIYGDGMELHLDYYNSIVISPMLTDVLAVMVKHGLIAQERLDTQMLREQRLAEELERVISPEGTFPVVGRSIVYRIGLLHALSHTALLGNLPEKVSPGQARAALTAVLKRQFASPDNFNGEWLAIGFAGHQINMSEAYINTGSLYMCVAGFLHLGLPADDPFWTSPAEDWTSKKAWSGIDVGADHALRDSNLK